MKRKNPNIPHIPRPGFLSNVKKLAGRITEGAAKRTERIRAENAAKNVLTINESSMRNRVDAVLQEIGPKKDKVSHELHIRIIADFRALSASQARFKKGDFALTYFKGEFEQVVNRSLGRLEHLEKLRRLSGVNLFKENPRAYFLEKFAIPLSEELFGERVMHPDWARLVAESKQKGVVGK